MAGQFKQRLTRSQFTPCRAVVAQFSMVIRVLLRGVSTYSRQGQPNGRRYIMSAAGILDWFRVWNSLSSPATLLSFLRPLSTAYLNIRYLACKLLKEIPQIM